MSAEISKMGWMSLLGFNIDLIDNFTYVDLNLFSNEKITQTEYYQMFIDALMKDMIINRENMVDNVQADIQELSSTLLGIDSSRLMKAVQLFAGKLANPTMFTDLLNAIAQGTAVDRFVDLVMESLVEAGCANYNGDQVRAMLKNLAPRLLSFMAKNPVLSFNLVVNLIQIVNAHFSEVTNAWLRSVPASYFEAQARQIAYTGGYSDVVKQEWYSDEVEYVTRGGLMNGMGEGILAPDRNTTRAEFATVLYRLEGCPASSLNHPFTDVEKGGWYEQAVAWAYQNGVVKGMTETTFAPDSNITREQMVTMLYRYANRVVPTKTLGEGYYALANLDTEAGDADAIEAALTEAAGEVATGLVSRAIRDSGDVREGEYVGIHGKHILASGPDPETALLHLADALKARSNDVILLFAGADARNPEGVRQDLAAKYPRSEVILQSGGQPVYEYILVLF